MAQTPHHGERAHALLSPSSASRWIACPPSVAMCQELGLESKPTAATTEGTTAHEVAETVLRQMWDGELGKTIAIDVAGATNEMIDHAEDYATYVIETASAIPACDIELFVERRIDLTAFVPESFGTVDCALFSASAGILHVIDYKYGKGVRVSAVDNAQMRLYALGLVDELELMGEQIQAVATTIYQPRIGNVSTEHLRISDLKRWGTEVLTPAARQAYAGQGEWHAGAHCTFCPARPRCRALAEQVYQLDALCTVEANTLSIDEVGDVLRRAEHLSGYIKALSEYALSEALLGNAPRGYKVVAGRSLRTYADEERVAQRLAEMGFDRELIYEQKLISVSACERLLGKKRYADEMSDLTVKPEGKPTLVPEDDKRPAITIGAEVFDGIQAEGE